MDIKGRFTRCFGYSCVTITDSGGVGCWFLVGRKGMEMKSITVDRMEEAVEYLVDTDEPCAQFRADHARAEFKAKSVRNVLFNGSMGTVAERNAKAETSKAYLDAKEEEFENFFQYEKMKNKRITETIVVDTWRSLNAGRNKGNIV